jgi:hypothetical protein
MRGRNRRCKNCNSCNVEYRVRTRDIRCRECNTVTAVNRLAVVQTEIHITADTNQLNVGMR